MATLTQLPGSAKLNEWLMTRRWPQRALSPSPAGSTLRPVPGDAGLPLLGHSLEMLTLGVDFALDRYRRYGPVYWTKAFGVRIVAAVGPEATQLVLTNKDKAFSQQGWAYFIEPFFPRGLMLLDFAEHRFHRRLMQEAFTQQRLTGYVDGMAEVVRAGLPAWPTGRFLLYPALKQLTLDVATRIFMATEPGAGADRLNRAFVATVRAGTAIVRRPVPGGRWAAGLRGRRLLERYFRENLPARRAGNGTDLFTALCHTRTDDGSVFSDDDVINHMVFLMMAAHDTSTISTTAAAYYLAKHPDWQDRARAESLALGAGPLDVAALDRLPTLDLVIKESLRLVAPVPTMARKTVRDTDVLGHHVPADTMVMVAPWVNHLLPELWPDPHRFDPERFSEPRREDRVHRYAWLPFGGGVHKCIGMHFGMYEVKTLLHELLLRYRWTVPPRYEVRWDPTALPVPTDGLPITLHRT